MISLLLRINGVVGQVGQEVPSGIPLDTGPGLNIASILDYGTTVVGLMFLIYLMKGIVTGDLISKSALDSIVEKAVRETLKETK